MENDEDVKDLIVECLYGHKDKDPSELEELKGDKNDLENCTVEPKLDQIIERFLKNYIRHDYQPKCLYQSQYQKYVCNLVRSRCHMRYNHASEFDARM